MRDDGGGGGGGRSRRPPPRVQPARTQVPNDLWRLEILVDSKEERRLRGYFWSGWGGGPPSERPEVSVMVREGGVTYTNVALHLKGAAGSFQPYDGKPGLTLNFSKNAKGRTFHGFGKLSLNNSVQDPSFISDALSREMFLEAGIPTPRTDHATVVLNGRDLGLYVVSEGWAKPFLARHFKDSGGSLFEATFVQDITGKIETKSGEKKDDQAILKRLARAASEPNSTNRWKRLGETLDLERFVTFMAMEVLVVHWDGYCLNRNNYRMFHDPTTDRIVFLPHGMDQMFGVTRSSPDSPIDPSMQGLVAQAVMSTREGRKLYFERLGNLRTNVFQAEKLTNRVHELARKIQPTLAAYGPELVREHRMFVDDLSNRIMERDRSLTQQLGSPPTEIEFNADGVAHAGDWRPRIVNRGPGEISFERTQADAGTMLKIRARRGGGTGSWRSQVVLAPGRYRFEGRAMTRGLGNTGAGVTLRVSGARTTAKRDADGKWFPVSFEFAVGGPGTNVELVAEFAASQGEAVFNETTLQVRRVDIADEAR